MRQQYDVAELSGDVIAIECATNSYRRVPAGPRRRHLAVGGGRGGRQHGAVRQRQVQLLNLIAGLDRPTTVTVAGRWIDARSGVGLGKSSPTAGRSRTSTYGRSLTAGLPEPSMCRGDLLLIDNTLTAHGRRPCTGDRRVLVAMS